MACRGGNRRGCGRRSGGVFIPRFGPGFGSGFGGCGGFNPFAPSASGSRSPFTPEVVAIDLTELFANVAPILEEIVEKLDEKMVEEAIRLSMEESGSESQAADKETKTSEQKQKQCRRGSNRSDSNNCGKKYRVDIMLGSETKPENVKISRKDNVMTIDAKTEKLAEDGSSRLYQEYTKKITLPENVDLSQLESSLSPSGILNIQAPFFPKPEENKPEAKNQPTKIPVVVEDAKTIETD